MAAEVINLLLGRYGHRVRIPGPGEAFTEAASVTILPVVRLERSSPRKVPGRRVRRQLEDDEREAEPIGPGDKECGQPPQT